MSLFEQGLSNNHISLEKLFANKIVKSVAGKLDLHELIKITIKGG
jgi:RNA-binding protein YhbY